MKRLLFASNLFPDEKDPIRGLDNAALLQAMSRDWEIRVLSPRPMLSSRGAVSIRAREKDQMFHPHYVASPYAPKIGSWCNDWLMEWALASPLKRLVEEFQPDVILCSWLFPDGCAFAKLACRHRIPLVLITQGTDSHGYLQIPTRRKKIIKAIGRAASVVCRSRNLADRLLQAGADEQRLKVIYNGVDTRIFKPRSQEGVRRELGLPEDTPNLLFVGNYLPVKNPLFLLRAHAELNRRRSDRNEPLARLVLIGDGPMRQAMEQLIADLPFPGTVDLRGREQPESVARWMNAADLLCISSHNEGFPNVILEAMACQLKVVSTDVGGIGEWVDRPQRGALVAHGDLQAYVAALEEALVSASTREVEASTALEWDWQRAAKEYGAVLEAAIHST